MKPEKKGLVESVKNILEGWADLTRAFEATVVDNLAATAPWLAPLAPAYLAFHAMINVLLFSFWVAFVVAAAIEMLGISTISTTVTFFNYNNDKHQKRKDDPAAPTWLAAAMALVYLVVVIVLNVILDNSDPVRRTAKGLLSILTVVAAVTLVLRSSHRQRVEEVLRLKAEDKAEREKRKLLKLSVKVAEKQPNESKVTDEKPLYDDWRQVPIQERMRIVEWMKTMSKNQVKDKIVEEYHVEERTAYNWIKNAEKLRSTSNQSAIVQEE